MWARLVVILDFKNPHLDKYTLNLCSNNNLHQANNL